MARSKKPRPPATVPAQRSSTSSQWRTWLALFAGLFVVTLLIYQPAWHGLPLWDDDGHLTRPGLQSLDGLWRIWFDVRATQQYYPLVHSAFWVMHQLWGDATTGYHIVNIGLHALSALLLAVLLRRLQVPGAWLAAFLFAVHPVQAESVAWMTELKNTLSTPFYLGAAIAFVGFDSSRRTRDWITALVLFGLALLCKTVTATLPVSLLILAWWRHGDLRWERDVRPVLPFFVLAIAGAAMTAWIEHTIIGAKGSDFALTAIERVLLAGRAVWFYLASLVWPANLIFTYPQWTISQAVWWQYLYPIALAVLAFALWRLRDRTRAPLAALLLYCAALAPALGFVNVFPFRYSFVADHFQYTASLAALAFFAAALTTVMSTRLAAPAARAAASLVILAPLSFLTWQYAHQYIDSETLYRTTIARNPSSWMAHHNLGLLLLHGPAHDVTGALQHVEESLRVKPDNPEALNSRGYIRLQQGDRAAARRDYEESIRLLPTFASPHNNLGVLLYKEGRLEEAMTQYQEAMRLNPADPEAQRNYGIILLDLGRTAEAAPYIERSYALNPDNPEVFANLASLRLQQGRSDEAVTLLTRAVQMRPDYPAARNNLGVALEKLRRFPEAEAQYREVVRLDPRSGLAHDNLGYVLLLQRKFAEAVPQLAEAIRLRPDSGPAYASLAAALLELGKVDESIDVYQQALRVPPNDRSADLHNGFGVALAQRGRMRDAADQFRLALQLDPAHPDARRNLARASGK